MKTIAVFCGSRAGASPIYAEAGRKLGHALAARSLTLVFGGGHIGMMGVLADAVLEKGGQVIGVIPRFLVEKELAHNRLTRLDIVETMHERKARMADLAEAFLALPGGFGTADEFFEILTWAQLKLHKHPIGLLEVNGYFAPLLAWMDHMVHEGFLRASDRDRLLVSDQPERILDLLAQKPASPVPDKWMGDVR